MTAAELPQLLEELKRGLTELYGDRLRGLYLFGSYARGTAEWDSDVDILVVLDEIRSYGGEIKRTSELGSSLSIKYFTSVSKVFISEADWATAENPFLLNVRREAIAA
jgi:predicted nucleotidyltransferase